MNNTLLNENEKLKLQLKYNNKIIDYLNYTINIINRDNFYLVNHKNMLKNLNNELVLDNEELIDKIETLENENKYLKDIIKLYNKNI